MITVLWDIDGTLLDFLAAEKAAIRTCFSIHGMGECTDAAIARYSAVNRRYWERLERGEITKKEVLIGRFREFFASEGLDPAKAEPFNADYQLALGDTCVFFPGGKEVLTAFHHDPGIRQFAVTNGTVIAQRKKLEKSGIGNLLDGVFISDLVGFEKPDRRFFDCVAAGIGGFDGDTWIVGDSLTSDMRGGNNAGIRCCLFDPLGEKRPGNVRVDRVISALAQVGDVVRMGRIPAHV